MVRKRGRFYYFDFQVKRVRTRNSTGETDREKAEKLERRARLAARARLRGEEPICSLTELVGKWLFQFRAEKSASYIRSVETFRRLHLYDLGDLPIDALTTFRVQGARTAHLLNGHGFASANHWLRILKVLCRWAVDLRMVDAVPWRVKMLKPQDPVRPILPAAQTQPWLEAVDAQEREAASRAVRLMLGLGLREMEAYGARWEWLNLTDGIYSPGNTKNRKAEKLRIRPWLRAYLRAIGGKKGLICPLPDGKKAYRGYCRRVMQKANAACGLEGITPHRLRGTYATQLMRLLPPKEVQRLMRHKAITTTLIYTTEDETLVDQAYQKLDEEMGLAG